MIVQAKSPDNIKKIIEKRYLEAAKAKFPSYITKIVDKFNEKHNISPQSIKIRSMQTRW
jgi:predicted metal-dependent hydrolase